MIDLLESVCMCVCEICPSSADLRSALTSLPAAAEWRPSSVLFFCFQDNRCKSVPKLRCCPHDPDHFSRGSREDVRRKERARERVFYSCWLQPKQENYRKASCVRYSRWCVCNVFMSLHLDTNRQRRCRKTNWQPWVWSPRARVIDRKLHSAVPTLPRWFTQRCT